MVFLLGRMGNNKQALTLIIERLGDVHRAIEFAKSQNDDDLWEDLLRYSETRPTFIRGLLENVGVEISPVRLIRRIKNGLEIPGLKEALIKILHDFQLQIELMEGCRKVLEGDCVELAEGLGKKQGGGFWLGGQSLFVYISKGLRVLIIKNELEMQRNPNAQYARSRCNNTRTIYRYRVRMVRLPHR